MNPRWLYYELRYWWLKMLYALGIKDEYPLIRPLWLLRSMTDKVQPIIFTYKTSDEESK